MSEKVSNCLVQYVSLSYTSVSGIGMIVSLVADLTGAAIGMSFCVSLTTVLQSISPHIPLPNSLMPKGIHTHFVVQFISQICH